MSDKLEQLAEKAAEKYRIKPSMTPEELFILGYKARDEEIEALQDKIDWLFDELNEVKWKYEELCK